MCGRLPEDSRVAHRYKGLEAELKGEGDQGTDSGHFAMLTVLLAVCSRHEQVSCL